MLSTNKADVLLGLQWGDEGKGKIVDVISPEYQVVARFQGGPNAGHTLSFAKQKYILHTIPSGIFHPACRNLIGNGVVIDPCMFQQEAGHLKLSLSKLKDSLLICGKAHLILPTHRLLDAAFEQQMGTLKIGSTLKGIGPAYTDKVARRGLRVADARRNDFLQMYQTRKREHLQHIQSLGLDASGLQIEGMSLEAYESAWFTGLELISKLEMVQSEVYINQALDQKKRVLAEGAQGSLLDIDFGTYPFVTSSSTIAAGACTGLGLAPSRIGEVMGIFKAYCTRVGSGPFPTELHDEQGEQLRAAGNEFGSTTGRPRRCGWLDLPALKYAVMINGVSQLIMTKADVLSSMALLKVCTAYKYRGKRVDYLPAEIEESQLEPIYQEMKSWPADFTSCNSFDALPESLRDYIRLIETHTGVKVSMVSTGPDRDQIIRLQA